MQGGERGHNGPPHRRVVRTASNGATTGHKLHVLIADHLGTVGTSVELSGTQPVTRREFKPYGEPRGPKPASWPNKWVYVPSARAGLKEAPGRGGRN
ncbi:hypothetical protein [Streptomyces sp. IBSBF 2507]|uniref:hypothetical protein n=1 Tax=Streptomyces sp. IBSBF 2507 TaxID=2903530 RepID=UPI00351EF4A6